MDGKPLKTHQPKGETLDSFAVSVLVVVLTVQLYTLLRHEKRLTRLETKIDLMLDRGKNTGGEG